MFWLALLFLQGSAVWRPISANPKVNFNPGFFFLICLKAFSLIIFSILFRASNSSIVITTNVIFLAPSSYSAGSFLWLLVKISYLFEQYNNASYLKLSHNPWQIVSNPLKKKQRTKRTSCKKTPWIGTSRSSSDSSIFNFLNSNTFTKNRLSLYNLPLFISWLCV